MILITAIFSVTLFALISSYEINFGCTDTCNDCINKNISPFLTTNNQCRSTKEYTYFSIGVRNGNGCGYAQDITDLYNKCSKECQTCQKIDNRCKAITDHPSSVIHCKPRACIKRGEYAYGVPCCDGLFNLRNKCIDSKQDCTDCGNKIELNKPCCDKSGINQNGKWRCAVGVCASCKNDDVCDKGKRCIAGCCG